MSRACASITAPAAPDIFSPPARATPMATRPRPNSPGTTASPYSSSTAAHPSSLGSFRVRPSKPIDAVQESDGAEVLSTGLPGLRAGTVRHPGRLQRRLPVRRPGGQQLQVRAMAADRPIVRGSAFVSGVIDREGDDGLRRLWEGEEQLPTPAEVDAPGLWLARIALYRTRVPPTGRRVNCTVSAAIHTPLPSGHQLAREVHRFCCSWPGAGSRGVSLGCGCRRGTTR